MQSKKPYSMANSLIKVQGQEHKSQERGISDRGGVPWCSHPTYSGQEEQQQAQKTGVRTSKRAWGVLMKEDHDTESMAIGGAVGEAPNPLMHLLE